MKSQITIWERVNERFKNNVIGVFLLAALGAGVFIANSLDVWTRITGHFNPPTGDLNLTSLTDANRPKPLVAYEPISANIGAKKHTDNSSVYPRGARVTIDLAHNRKGDASITLRAIELNIQSFEPGVQTALRYKARGDKIIGAGTTKPHVFHVALFGNRVGPAMRITERSVSSIAKSGNFLDTDDPMLLELSKNDDSESIDIEVTAEQAGLYEIYFIFTYSVLGETRQKRTDPAVWIYFDGA